MSGFDWIMTVVLGLSIASCVPGMFRWKEINATARYRVFIQVVLWIPLFVVAMLYTTHAIPLSFLLRYAIAAAIEFVLIIIGTCIQMRSRNHA